MTHRLACLTLFAVTLFLLAACSSPGSQDCQETGTCSDADLTDAGNPDADVDAVPPIDAVPPDLDRDGLTDSIDNCPSYYNPLQEDEDSDGIGDLCDNCPGIYNPGQEDEEEPTGQADNVGDACDPRPSQGGDSIIHFEGFNYSSALDHWAVGDGNIPWVVQDGSLVQPVTTRIAHVLYWNQQLLSDAVVESAIHLDEIPPSTGPGDNLRLVGLVAKFRLGSVDLGKGYSCAQVNDPSVGPTTRFQLHRLDDSSVSVLGDTSIDPLSTSGDYIHRIVVTSDPIQQCDIRMPDDSTHTIPPKTDATHADGFVGVRTHSVAASFRYIVVYGIGSN